MLLKCLMCIYNSWGFFWECLHLLQWSVSKCRYNMGLENATEATAGLTLEKVVPVGKALWLKFWHHICMYWHVQKNAHQKKKKSIIIKNSNFLLSPGKATSWNSKSLVWQGECGDCLVFSFYCFCLWIFFSFHHCITF